MKKKITLLLMITTAFAVNAQKKATIKIKGPNKNLHYYNLPRVMSEKKHNTFSIKFTDKANEVYTFGASSAMIKGYGYLNGFNYAGGNDYVISANQLSDNFTEKKVVTRRHEKTGSDGKVHNYVLYSYECFHNQEIQVVITSHLNSDAIILDTILRVRGSVEWPKDFLTTKGYSSEKALKQQFIYQFLAGRKDETAEDKKARIERKEKFDKKSVHLVTLGSFRKDVKNLLNDQLSVVSFPMIISAPMVKTKDERFKLLDSTTLYFKEGVELFNKQMKSRVYINGHSKEVYDKFNNLYRIYKKFNTKEYFDIIDGEEDARMFELFMRNSVFVYSALTSRYDEAITLFEITEKEYLAEEEIKKQDKSLKAETFGQLKMSITDKFYHGMLNIMPMVEREKELFNKHSAFYKFEK